MTDNMKILVTGGHGQVGRSLQLIMDAYYVGRDDCDLLDQSAVDDLIYDEEPDIVIHLGAKVSGIEGNLKDPYEHIWENLTIDSNVIGACRRYGVTRFITLLSTCAYQDDLLDKGISHHEHDILDGKPAVSNMGYAYAKRCTAIMIDALREQGLKYQYLIPCNIYGPIRS